MEAFDALTLAATDSRDPLLPLWVMEWLAKSFLYVWLFALGATVGSFLNVVVYRLPRGKNLAWPGSFCPKCGHPIRLSDNIPILSWLSLGGRCRDCGGAISSRYVIVELIVAAMFLAVLVANHFFPAGIPTVGAGLSPHDGVPFWIRYGLQVSLFATLLGAVLISADDFRVPEKLFVPVLLAALILPLMWPPARNMPSGKGGLFGDWQANLAFQVAGMAVGAGFGIIAAIVEWRLWRGRVSIGPIAVGAAMGTVIGLPWLLWWLPFAFVLCWLLVQWLPASSPFASNQVVEGVPVVEPNSDIASERPVDSTAITSEVHIEIPLSEDLDSDPS